VSGKPPPKLSSEKKIAIWSAFALLLVIGIVVSNPFAGRGRDRWQREVRTDVVASERTQDVSAAVVEAEEVEPSPQVPSPRKARLDDDGNVIADTFNVRYHLRGDRLTVILETDLPDETDVMPSVYRTYKKKGSSEDYVVDYSSGKSTVGDWRKPQTIRLDNDKWKAELDRVRKILAAAGVEFPRFGGRFSVWDQAAGFCLLS
jgi:hypothetical protein